MKHLGLFRPVQAWIWVWLGMNPFKKALVVARPSVFPGKAPNTLQEVLGAGTRP